MAAPIDTDLIEAVLSRRSGAAEGAAIRALVKWWCERHGGCAAALYSSDGTQRLAQHGDRVFPASAKQPSHDSGLNRLELPGGGVLLHSSDGFTGDIADDGILMLATAASMADMKRQVREQNIQAMSQGVELVALYEVGLAITSILDLEELAQEVLSRALMLTECKIGAVYTLDDNGYTLACASGDARAVITASDVDLAALKRSGGHPDVEILSNASAVMAVSVEAEGEPRGLLVVGRETSENSRAFSPKDRSTLSLFANQAAIALEQARLHQADLEKERLNREMELAAEIQKQLLPDTMPSISGFEVLGWNRPARHVGGDYFGFRQLADDRWALTLGDVSGKGAPAALLVSTLDSALRVLIDQLGVTAELGATLNQHVWESSSANKFITLLVISLDPETGTMSYVNAGHNDGIVIRTDGSLKRLKSAGAPIGMLPGATYLSQDVDLGLGDLVCIYSDGITECPAPDDEEYEIDRLIELLRKHHGEPLDEILNAIDHAVTEFGAGLPQGDDQTVILLRRSAAD